MIGLIIVADIWMMLWVLRGFVVKKLLEEILAEIKRSKEDV